jgi:tight adherence protein B
VNVAIFGGVAALLAAAGAYLIYTSVAFEWRGRGPSVDGRPRPPRFRVRAWLDEAGAGEVAARELVVVLALMGAVGAAGAYALFGGWLAPLVAGIALAAAPVSVFRARRRQRLRSAAEAWPRLLEELRLRTGSLGQSIPQALFEAGRRVPPEWRQAFAAAEREWLLTTDFPRTAALLKERLADPTVDAVCETLVVAHEVGGPDLDTRLAELIEDRVIDLQARKDAASRQAGVRFARRFVLLVPLGMALAGLSIGSGRSAYGTAGGQVAVAAALLAVAACWAWSGRLMRVPDEPRVFR